MISKHILILNILHELITSGFLRVARFSLMSCTSCHKIGCFSARHGISCELGSFVLFCHKMSFSRCYIISIMKGQQKKTCMMLLMLCFDLF